MTVGELVENAIDVDALIPPAMRGGCVSEVMERYSITVLGLLRDLGIWDAEIHDAVIHPTLDGLSTCLLFENGVAATFTEAYTGKPGRPTRVVCLLPPVEEEK